MFFLIIYAKKNMMSGGRPKHKAGEEIEVLVFKKQKSQEKIRNLK